MTLVPAALVLMTLVALLRHLLRLAAPSLAGALRLATLAPAALLTIALGATLPAAAAPGSDSDDAAPERRQDPDLSRRHRLSSPDDGADTDSDELDQAEYEAAAAKLAPEDRGLLDGPRLTLRTSPFLALMRGEFKIGRRGLTERQRFAEDLNLGPLQAGLMSELIVDLDPDWRVGIGYFGLTSVSPGTKHQSDATLIKGQLFPAGVRTRTRVSIHAWHLEGGLTWRGENYRLGVLVGLRWLQTNAWISGAGPQETRARTETLNVYFPAFTFALRLYGNLWGRFESRSSYVSIPFATTISDYRVHLLYETDRFEFGVGGEAIFFTVYRSKDFLTGRRVNRYQSFSFYGVGLSFQIGIKL